MIDNDIQDIRDRVEKLLLEEQINNTESLDTEQENLPANLLNEDKPETADTYFSSLREMLLYESGKVENQDIIQSYLITTAKYNFNVYEKRIFYMIIRACQFALEGKKLDKGFVLDKTIFNDLVLTMPTSCFLMGERDNNHSRIKTALRNMRNKVVEYETGKEWAIIGIIEKPRFDRAGWVRFEIQPEIWTSILNFSKGHRNYELLTAMKFDSEYSMRMYELISGQKSPLTYKIDQLRSMFCLENKYKNTADLILNVFEKAKTELDKRAPYSFDYVPLKTGKKITSIRFKPYYIAKNRDMDLEGLELAKQVNLSWYFDPAIRDYLLNNLFFTSDEIKRNIDLFRLAHENIPDLLILLSQMNEKKREKTNYKGWIINTLKGKLQDKGIDLNKKNDKQQ